jgi:hypothetical protein
MSTQQPTNDSSNDTKERLQDYCCDISMVDCYFVMLMLISSWFLLTKKKRNRKSAFSALITVLPIYIETNTQLFLPGMCEVAEILVV